MNMKILMALLIALISIGCLGIYYCLHDKRYICDVVRGADDIEISVDGKNKSVVAFRDSFQTVFSTKRSIPIHRRLVLAIQDIDADVPQILAITKLGVGAVWGRLYLLHAFDWKTMVCCPWMNVSYDVSDDMKGLAATVEERRVASHVEYAITWCKKGSLHKIVIRLREEMFNWIAELEENCQDSNSAVLDEYTRPCGQ